MTDYVGFSVNDDDDDSLFKYGQYWTLGILVALAWHILKYREALDTEDRSSLCQSRCVRPGGHDAVILLM